MKILAIEKERPGLTEKDFLPFLKPEAETVWQLYTNNIIREIYFDNEKSSAILILECKDKNEAENILSELPLVKFIHIAVLQ
jgi:hypothetical protein